MTSFTTMVAPTLVRVTFSVEQMIGILRRNGLGYAIFCNNAQVLLSIVKVAFNTLLRCLNAQAQIERKWFLAAWALL